MVNKRFWLVILAIVLVFGMSIVGCDNGSTDGTGGGGGIDSALNGTWIGYNVNGGEAFGEDRNKNGKWELFLYSTNTIAQKGTYTLNGSTITFTVTHQLKSNELLPIEGEYISIDFTYFPKENKYETDSVIYIKK